MRQVNMKKFIAVFDETGTSNRPQPVEESGFGVGGIIFPLEHASVLAAISKQIGSIVRKEDFKYKDVQNSEAARELFIKALNSTNPPVYLFAFYAHGACMVHEIQRTKEAAVAYGTKPEQRSSPRGEGFVPFDSFIAYMASCIGAHAASNGYAVDIYWDRRTDLDQMKESFDKHIASKSTTLRYKGVANLVSFCGRAKKMKCRQSLAWLASLPVMFGNTLDQTAIRYGLSLMPQDYLEHSIRI